MTGRTGSELALQSLKVFTVFSHHGITVLDPVAEEGVMPGDGPIATPMHELEGLWQRDKQMIREADVLVDLTPHAKSEGVAHEIGLARYCYWMPVVRVFTPKVASIAHYEDDLIVPSLEEAAREIVARWGSWPKRLMWRVRLYGRSAPKHYFYKLRRWFQ